jgi:hypothetical protein
MLAREFWRTITVDRADLLDRFLAVLREQGTRFCVIGGQGVNAYAEPVVSLDLDIVIAASDVAAIEDALRREFSVERFEHSLDVSLAGSDLRVQIQTGPRYVLFIEHASERDVLGVRLPVARIEDVLQGKIWAVEDPTRRPSKRLKDLADIARLPEGRPDLRPRVPSSILGRLT